MPVVYRHIGYLWNYAIRKGCYYLVLPYMTGIECTFVLSLGSLVNNEFHVLPQS